MEIQRQDLGLVTVLRLKGEVDMDGVNGLRVALLTCIKTKRTRVVINLGASPMVSYLGIGVLLERMRQLRGLGGDLKLAVMHLGVRRTLDMASVTKLFTICETEAEAVEGFRQAA